MLVKLLDNKDDIFLNNEEIIFLQDGSSNSREKLETLQSLVVQTNQIFNQPKQKKSKS